MTLSNPGTGGLPEGVLLRPAEPADATGITRLMNLDGVRYGTLRLPYQSEKSVAERLAQPVNGAAIVADFNGSVIGHAELSRFNGRRSHAGSVAVSVHDEWTRRGIGRSLLSALIDTADRWLGLRRLELQVFADNRAAIALYRDLGFVDEGCLRAYAIRDGLLADVLAMARLVEPLPRMSVA